MRDNSDYTATSLLDVLLHAGFGIGELSPVYGTSGGDRVDLRAASETIDWTLTEAEKDLLQPLKESMQAEYKDGKCHRSRTVNDMKEGLRIAWTKVVLDHRRTHRGGEAI